MAASRSALLLSLAALAGCAEGLKAAGEAAAPSKCYGLALSGGGDKGAYEAGVIQGLVSRLAAEERQWNVVTGISAGSIVSTGAALFDIGDEEAMAEFLISTITNFTKKSVYKNWFPFGVVTGLGKNGIYDTQPLYDTLLNVISSRSRGNRMITIGATDDATGTLALFNETEWTNDTQWADRVRASAAIPGLFQSVTIDGRVLSDGGCVLGVDVFSAVERCRALGVQDEDITVDIVTCDNKKSLRKFDPSKDNNAVDLLVRGLQVQRHDQQKSDIFDACEAYPKVNWRYLVEPSQALPSNGIEFDKTNMLKMVQIGKEDAASVTAGGACDAASAAMRQKKLRHSEASSIWI